MPSRTPSVGAYSSNFQNRVDVGRLLGVSPPKVDDQNVVGGDRQQPVGHGTGDVSPPLSTTNDRSFNGLGNNSRRSLGLFEFQAASTPMIRQQV